MREPPSRPTRDATPDSDLRALFQLSRHFRREDLPPTTRIEELWPLTLALRLSPLGGFSLESLQNARHFAEEITVLYVSHFHDLSQLPVTFYKREKAIRRRLDEEFSRLFKELMKRLTGRPPPDARLITEEPIYYLLQKAREKSFPKATRSQGRRPHLETLRMRFHVDLSARLDPEGREDGRDRRILLPYEL